MHDRVAGHHETLILGAGPAGLQLGYFLSRAGRDYRILEAGEGPGTFFRTFPRHRKLISVNKVHTGSNDPEVQLRHDWNSLLSDDLEMRFSRYSNEYFPPADLLVDYLGDYASRFDLAIEPRTRVARVSRNGCFRLEAEDGRVFTCDRLVVATGVSRPNLPPVPGIELAETYFDVSTEPEDFADQRVLVLGKGNSGFEVADSLTPTTELVHVLSPHPVQFAWRTHYVGHLRAINNNFLDTYQLKSQNAVLDAALVALERRADGKIAATVRYSHADGEVEVLVYDRVIACTGFRFDASIFEASCRPALAIDDRLPRQTSAWESTNVPGLFFAGTLTQMRDWKRLTSGFIHGFRYNCRALSHILEQRYHAVSWPSTPVEANPVALSRAILERVNRTSALWQMFAFLGDVFAWDADEGMGRHFQEVPVDYFRDGGFGTFEEALVLTLEFGPKPADPFAIERHPDPLRAAESAFLHPVVRRFRRGEQVSEIHLLENLFGEWRDEQQHLRPLCEYLEREVGAELVLA